MQEVAHHLQKHVQTCDAEHRDVFARSSYNRYYYSCFLLVREAFSEMNSEWSSLPHKSYPEILRGQIKTKLRQERRISQKNKDFILSNIIDSALRAIEELAKIIEQANAARIIADYEPQIKVTFNDTGRFSLNSIHVTVAHEWSSQIKILIRNLLSAWKQVDV